MKNPVRQLRDLWLLLIVIFITSTSCSDWDEFKKFTEEGEIIYPGKVLAIDVLPGDGRVRIEGELSPDPRIDSYRIYWNDYADSIVFLKEAINFTHTLNVLEGTKSFVFYTYDENGNRSVPVIQIGTSYGTNYRNRIANRLISSVYATDSSTLLIWKQIDKTLGPKYTEVTFTLGADEFVIQTPITEDTTELMGFITDGNITYNTSYLPELDCIDEFFTEIVEYTVVR
jgi:hypothetical protein